MATATPSCPDAHLLAELRQGNAAAFSALYEHYWPGLYRTAYFKTGRREVAEELVQEVFVRLWDKRQTLLFDNAGAWLHTCLRHLVIDYVRKNAHEQQYLVYLHYLGPERSSVDAETELADLSQALDQALRSLPPKTETIFRLSRFEQLPTLDIARRLGLSEKAVEYHITKALRFLRSHLRHFASLNLPLLLLLLD